MSNYKNPFEPGGKFHNPRITDASRVTEPRIMPRWVEEEEMPYFNTEFYNIQTGMLIEKVVGDVQIISIEENKYFEYKDSFLPNMGFKRDFVSYIINKSKSDNNFHVLKGLNTAELNVRAFLSCIKKIEAGTSNPQLDYNSWNGLDTFSDYSQHPGKNPNTGSSAAGAYQFLLKTWNYIADLYDLTDFSPKNQDKAVLYKMRDDIKKLELIKQGNVDKVFDYLHNKNNLAWTSFHAISKTYFQELFKSKIIIELNNNSDIVTEFGQLLNIENRRYR